MPLCEDDPILPWSVNCEGRGVTAVAGVDEVGMRALLAKNFR